MKKILEILLIMAFIIMPVCAFADIGDLPQERQQPLLVDEGDILTAEEEATLLKELERISREQKCDLAVIVPRTLGYQSAETYTENFYDQNGYGQGTTKDGIMLMVCLEERDYYFDTAGAAQDWLPYDTKLRIEDMFMSDLSEGNYLNAFLTYATACERVLKSVDRRETLYLSDRGGFLTAEQQKILTRKLESNSHVGSLCDIVVLTVETLNGQSAVDYVTGVYSTDTYLHGVDQDKIVMVVDRTASKCYCVTGGDASRYFTDDDLTRMEQSTASGLSSGDVLGAFTGFADTAYGQIRSYYEEQTQYQITTQRSPKLFSGFRAIISAFIGLIAGTGTATALKGQLKSIKQQTSAADYMLHDKMRMTDEQDLYLYSNVSKTVRVSESSKGSGGGFSSGGSHFSSGGVSHSGHGGKF